MNIMNIMKILKIMRLYASLLIILFAIFTTSNNNNIKDCITIQGGGYSGFWHVYGYLQRNNITKNSSKNIYCYSSGCLAYVALLSHNDSKSLYKLANIIRNENNNNNYRIKEQFINIIATNISNMQNYNLNILTSNYLGQCIIKKPTTVSELLIALDETTNIPLITTKLDLRKNIDGWLCYIFNFNTNCIATISFPYDYKFYKNIFNSKFKYEDVLYFIKK